jgi:hypothetical protein
LVLLASLAVLVVEVSKARPLAVQETQVVILQLKVMLAVIKTVAQQVAEPVVAELQQ